MIMKLSELSRMLCAFNNGKAMDDYCSVLLTSFCYGVLPCIHRSQENAPTPLLCMPTRDKCITVPGQKQRNVVFAQTSRHPVSSWGNLPGKARISAVPQNVDCIESARKEQSYAVFEDFRINLQQTCASSVRSPAVDTNVKNILVREAYHGQLHKELYPQQFRTAV